MPNQLVKSKILIFAMTFYKKIFDEEFLRQLFFTNFFQKNKESNIFLLEDTALSIFGENKKEHIKMEDKNFNQEIDFFYI